MRKGFLLPEMFQTVGFVHFRLSFKTVKFFLIFICQDGEANWNFLDCGSFLFLHGDRIISCFLVLLCLLTGWCNVFYCNGEVLFDPLGLVVELKLLCLDETNLFITVTRIIQRHLLCLRRSCLVFRHNSCISLGPWLI